MKNIQPFIDLGFYTVPLKGELKRLEDGSKTTPQYKKNWKEYFQQNFNEQASAIGGTITGAISNIIAIDCDSQETYNMFMALDPTYEFHFISKGKPKGGGTIIYKYPHVEDGAIIPSFSIQDDIINLDFYSDNGFVYLPTSANETKEPWDDYTLETMPQLKDMPTAVSTLIHTLYKQYLLSKNQTGKETPQAERILQRANYLAPQIELMLGKGEFMPSVFRVITPKDFRSFEQYVKHGYLHPQNIPSGRGSEYLSKISAILGNDPSISPDLYIKAIQFINNLWDDPIKAARLEQTIIDPMISGNASINGESIWQYDEHWKTRGLAFTTKFGEAAEVFFDDVRALYYLVNHTSGLVKTYHKDSDIYSYMETVGISIPARKDFKGILPLVRTSIEPSLPFGFYSKDEYTRGFNMFQQTPALRILSNPDTYKEMYKYPENTINFIYSLVPDVLMRNYLLKFIKRKLLTFEYTPVVLYFIGAHGSGKDTLVTILEKIIGIDYLARPTTKEFLEQFNGWLVDKYFVQLDEYGNQLSKITDKEEALGRIKTWSGKPNVQIRQMRTDGFNYDHRATFIMTANSNPLVLEDGDRRAAFFETPNVLKDEKWVIEAGGITEVQEQIAKEISDFCYYLATVVDDMHPDDYVSPPETVQKHKLIASKLPAAQRLAYYFKHNLIDEVYKLCEEWDLTKVFNGAIEGRIYEDDLFELYSNMTDHNGVKRGLASAMKAVGYEKIPTTRDQVKAYYFKIPELQYYNTPETEFKDYTPELG